MSIRDDFFAAKAKGSLWDVAVSIKRGNPLPLDADSIFESYKALEAYAADVLAYPGQIVAVVNADSTGIYYLDQDLAIQPVGVIPAGDNLSIDMDENDVISLHDFGKAFYKYIPEVKDENGETTSEAKYEKVSVDETNLWKAGLEPKVVTEDGKLVIGWFEPNPTTIEGVNDQVTAVQGTVADLEESVGVPSTEGQEATGLYKEVEDVQEEVTELAGSVGSEEDALGETVQTVWAYVNDHTTRIETIETEYVKTNNLPVKGIAADDKVLSLSSDALISATVSMSYDTENKAIKLYGKDNVELGSVDATPFIKDGMLDDVSYNADNNTLTFTWNTESGKTTDTVVLSDIIEPYTAGSGLELSGNEFKVKLDNGSESFLTVSAEGLKLSGITSAIATAKSEAIADAATAAAGIYATQTALGNLETALDERLDALEVYDHSTYATKTELGEYKTTVASTYATKDELKATDNVAKDAQDRVGTIEVKVQELVDAKVEENVIEIVKVNGEALTPDENKAVDITVPTKFSDITDDSGFDSRITAAKKQADKGVDDAAAAAATAANNTAAIAELGNRATTLESHINGIEGQSNGLLKDVAALKAHDEAHTAEFNTLSGTVSEHTTQIAGKAAQTDLNNAVSRITANETAITTLNDTTIPNINAKIDTKANKADVYTKEEVNSITGNLGDKTIVELIEESKYDDTAVRDLISAEASRAVAAEKANATEITRVEGLVSAEKSRAENAEAGLETRIATMEKFWEAADNPNETIDKLAEIVEYIESDQSGALDMASDIQKNSDRIDAIYKVDGENESGILVTEIARVESKADDNTAEILAIKNSESGILATAKKYTDDSIAGIPAATAETLGLVKVDNVSIKADAGVISVKAISTDLLTQGTQELILNGGSAVSK